MAGYIVDPTNPAEAIAPSGRLAVKVYLAPIGTPVDDREAWKPVGWADPEDMLGPDPVA